MSETVISLKDIKKSYGKHQVLTNVDMEIHKGDIYGLVGKNGSGKTTIFKIILGLSEFQGGKLLINDNQNVDEQRKKIGFFVGLNFFGELNGRKNLEYYRRLKGIKDKKEVDRVLEIVDLAKAKGNVKGYSLGMKQRLGIANAILGNPEILILDEPTNGLDPQGIVDVRTLIQKLNKEYGMTIVVSSHILGELQNTAHRFGIVNNGLIVKEITGADLEKENKYVKLEVETLEKAKKVLAEAGIPILNELHETVKLEDYYFQLIGDEKE